MNYGDRLKYWAIARLLPNNQWMIIARFRSRSNAAGHLAFLQRHLPQMQFRVVFEIAESELRDD